jgi:hypothetical protein
MNTALQNSDPFAGLRKRIATLEKRIGNLKQAISEQREQLRDAYRRLEVAQDRREFDSLKAFIRVKSADRGWNAASIMSFVTWAISQGLSSAQIAEAAKPKPELIEPQKSQVRKS